jgi:hypothetical protein
MAEEPNQVEAERIKDDIERTRANMSGTIDEIQERLNPNNLVQQAKDSVRDATASKVKGALNTAGQAAKRAVGQAQTTGTRAVSTARQNPLPAALVASGVAWLMSRGLTSRRDRGSRRWSRRVDGGSSSLMGNRQAQGAFVAGVIGYYLVSRRSASMRSGPGGIEYATSTDGTANTERLRRAVIEPARELGASASRISRRAQQKASEYAGRGKDVGQQVTRWVGANPLAVGAAVVALGTVVGLSMSDDDDDWTNDRRDEWSGRTRQSSGGTGYSYGDDDFGAGYDPDVERPSSDPGPKPGMSGRSSRM